MVFAPGGAASVTGHLPRPKSVSGQWFQFVGAMVSQLTKLLCCLTSDLFCLQKLHCKLLPPILHSTSWYWCDRCIGLVFDLGQSPTLPNSWVRQCEILKYIKSGLSCLFAYQFHQSIAWMMELAINTIWAGETI